MGESVARSVAAKMLWATFVLGAIGAVSTGVSLATWILGARLTSHPATPLHYWRNVIAFGFAAPFAISWLQLASAVGALRFKSGGPHE